jgi:hypothetical protein
MCSRFRNTISSFFLKQIHLSHVILHANYTIKAKEVRQCEILRPAAGLKRGAHPENNNQSAKKIKIAHLNV